MVSERSLLASELDALLMEPRDSARERERSTFDTATRSFGNRFVLFGAGNLGRKAMAALRADGIAPLAFVDNNPRLWGQFIDGVPVLPLADAARQYGQTATIVMTIWRGEGTDTMAERRRPLIEAGCVSVVDFGVLFWKYADALLPHYSLDLPHKVLADSRAVRSCFDLWADDASRREYVAQVRWRLWLDFDNLPPPVKEEIYFPRDLMKILDDEVFVDCGAYDGDTLRDFIRHSNGKFKLAYGFEADHENFGRLQQFIDGLSESFRGRIKAMSQALSDHAGVLHFATTGTAASAVASSGTAVPCVTIDDVLEQPPTWIKMDIEGSEPAALRGAKNSIVKYAPVLSICVYHSQNHLWTIPMQIAAMRGDYAFYLRPFVPESWDLVCYAIPPARSM